MAASQGAGGGRGRSVTGYDMQQQTARLPHTPAMPTRMQVGVHKVVLKQHAKVRVHAQRHDVGVERGAAADEVRDTGAGLKALHEDIPRGP